MKAHFTLSVAVPAAIAADPKLLEAGLKEIEQTLVGQFHNSELVTTVQAGRAHVELEDVRAFHEKMMVPMSPKPALLDLDGFNYRFKFLQEELDELGEGFEEGDLDKVADSLADLVYVAVGTALMMGIPWQSVWARVQRANMTKRLAKPDGSDSKRGNPLDVIKPEDFVAPSHWRDLGLTPNDVAPVFHATNAVLSLAYQRSQGIEKPEQDMFSFVAYPGLSATSAAATGAVLTAAPAGSEITGDGSGTALPPLEESQYAPGASHVAVQPTGTYAAAHSEK